MQGLSRADLNHSGLSLLLSQYRTQQVRHDPRLQSCPEEECCLPNDVGVHAFPGHGRAPANILAAPLDLMKHCLESSMTGQLGVGWPGGQCVLGLSYQS